VKFHVDDLKSTHIDPKVNDNFLSWLNHKYGKHGEVKATRGKVHDYLGMTFTYSQDGVTVDMRKYIKSMIDEFPIIWETVLLRAPLLIICLILEIQRFWTSNGRRNYILLLRKDYLPANGQGQIFTQLLP
jgi:hypothetical protein